MEATADAAPHVFSGIEGGNASNMDWLVLSATNPKRLKDRLVWEIMESEKQHLNDCPVFTAFCPYTFMPSEGTSKMVDKNSFSLRMALRNYVFVQCKERPFSAKIAVWNSLYEDKAFFLRNTDKKPARIPNAEMLSLISACSEDNIDITHSVSIEDLDDLTKPGDAIKGKLKGLTGIPFLRDDSEYKILEVRPKGGGVVECRIELTLFNVTFDDFWVTLRNVDFSSQHSESNKQGHLVADMQRLLLDIFRRKVNEKENDRTRTEGIQKLQAIYDYRDKTFPDGSMKRHFQALMLICSHLLKEQEGVSRFQAEVSDELSTIATFRESKAATDTRAYLHIAMYIATGNPYYRNLAKDYIRKYNPKSSSLKMFVTTSCKIMAKRYVGSTYRENARL